MEYRISKRAAGVTPSLTLAIDAQAKQLKAAGEDVVGFGAGEPDFDTPVHIRDAAVSALNSGITRYTPSSGMMALREVVAQKMGADRRVSFSPSQVIISNGGKHACFNVISAVCQEGDEVIIPCPYWVSYPEMVKLAGATPVLVPTTDEAGFKITPDTLRKVITPRTRLFILNSPSNPTGCVYSRDEILALAKICVENHILIMSDEIYEKLTYDGVQHTSVASLGGEILEHSIIVHGLSKAYAMTGWRIGVTVAPEPIAKAVGAMQSHSTSNPVSFSQMGAIAALTGSQKHLTEWVKEYDRRRMYAYDRLVKMPGLTCVKPQGAFYLFPSIKKTGLKSVDFAKRLLDEERVALVPGIAFGTDDNVRLSYATSLENIQKGLDRMEKFCQRLANR